MRKLFVGGLPWSTTTDTLKKHFEQYGEIEEAAVIFDKETGKSKGFGFVTMRERKSADEACKDPNPYIDGRKANVNLAFLGQKPRTHSFSGSHTNLAALGLRSGAITPTSPSAGLLGSGGHIGMHGAGLTPSGYLYPGNLTSMTAAALMLQQNLALATLQQQQQQQLALAAAVAQHHHQQQQQQQQHHQAAAAAAQQHQSQAIVPSSIHATQATVMNQHHGSGGVTPQQILEIQALYAAQAQPTPTAALHHSVQSSSVDSLQGAQLLPAAAQAGVPLTPATAAQLALLSQLTNSGLSNTGNQSP